MFPFIVGLSFFLYFSSSIGRFLAAAPGSRDLLESLFSYPPVDPDFCPLLPFFFFLYPRPYLLLFLLKVVSSHGSIQSVRPFFPHHTPNDICVGRCASLTFLRLPPPFRAVTVSPKFPSC